MTWLITLKFTTYFKYTKKINEDKKDMTLHVSGRRRFKLEKQLGAGAFGEIYSGIDVESGDAVAVKLERMDAEYPQLIYEARVYDKLASKQGVPRVFHIGQEGNYNVMVMQRLGPNLESLFNQCHRRFSLQTVLLLGDKMLHLIEQVHDGGFLHRDIKPDNFVIGSNGNNNQIYIIDFGLSKCYMNPETSEHIKFRDDKHLTGTARYASVNNHKGREQSRRDDLESLGYVLVYFLKGVLPWQNIKKKVRDQLKYQRMMEIKMSTAHTSLDLVAGLPDAFTNYFLHVRQLKFDERPDYTYLQTQFRNMLTNGITTDIDASSPTNASNTSYTETDRPQPYNVKFDWDTD